MVHYLALRSLLINFRLNYVEPKRWRELANTTLVVDPRDI